MVIILILILKLFKIDTILKNIDTMKLIYYSI